LHGYASAVDLRSDSDSVIMSLREIRMALEGRREQDEAYKARLSGYTDTIKAELRRRGIPVRTPNKTGIEREAILRRRLVQALDRGADCGVLDVVLGPPHPFAPACASLVGLGLGMGRREEGGGRRVGVVSMALLCPCACVLCCGAVRDSFCSGLPVLLARLPAHHRGPRVTT